MPTVMAAVLERWRTSELTSSESRRSAGSPISSAGTSQRPNTVEGSPDLLKLRSATTRTDIAEPVFRRFTRDPLDPLLYLIEMRDHGIARGQRPAHLRQDSNGRRDVAHDVSFNQSKPVVIEAAQAHCHSPTSSLRRD